MSEATNEPLPTVSERIDRFIHAVDHTLADGGMGDEERHNVTADLRAQIEEMLAERADRSGKPAGVEDVEAVLAALDPPESYNEAAQPKEAEKTVHAGHSCGRGNWRREAGAFYRGGPRWFWGKRRVVQAVRQAIHSFSPFGHPAFLGMTERARTAVSLAKSEAQRMRHDFIGTEHLLLGLILEGTGVASQALTQLGMDREWARQEAARLVNPGTSPVAHERLPLTPRLRQAIEEARLAARNLGHDFLGTEHLVLGLLDVPGVGGQIIANRGLTSQQVREEVLKRIPAATTQSSAGQSSAAQSSAAQATPAPFTFWPASATQEIRVGDNGYKIVAGGADTGGVYAAIEAVIASPDGLGTRTHTREDISVYVLEGSVRVRVGERIVDLGKGDFSRIPRGTPHEIQPVGQTARIMLIAAPAGIEKLIPALAAAADLDSRRKAAERFGVIVE